MIYSLNGKLIHSERDFVVIECGGVGYKCMTSLNTIKTLPHINENTMLYTHMIVKEDNIELCGFRTQEELNTFKILISVSGVGAKVAVAILSELSPEQFALAVANGDTKSLTRAAGVGNKLAQRVILELKDKIKKLAILPETVQTGSATVSVTGGNVSQAIGALAVLGYSPDDVMPFMNGISPDMSVEQIISSTLKAIGKKG